MGRVCHLVVLKGILVTIVRVAFLFKIRFLRKKFGKDFNYRNYHFKVILLKFYFMYLSISRQLLDSKCNRPQIILSYQNHWGLDDFLFFQVQVSTKKHSLGEEIFCLSPDFTVDTYIPLIQHFANNKNKI